MDGGKLFFLLLYLERLGGGGRGLGEVVMAAAEGMDLQIWKVCGCVGNMRAYGECLSDCVSFDGIPSI